MNVFLLVVVLEMFDNGKKTILIENGVYKKAEDCLFVMNKDDRKDIVNKLCQKHEVE